jgi:preprotein translocase SecE subunit
VARDRKRAKQRRERAARAAGSLSPSQPIRSEVPGSLDHASGEADEFEAALVRGADGIAVPAEEERDGALAEDGEDGAATEDLLEEPGEFAAVGTAGVGRGGGGAQAVTVRPSGAPLRGGNRVIGFLRASWAELQRVQWPDRRQVTQGTAVVIGFVAVAGVYLGVADFVAKELVEYIL